MVHCCSIRPEAGLFFSKFLHFLAPPYQPLIENRGIQFTDNTQEVNTSIVVSRESISSLKERNISPLFQSLGTRSASNTSRHSCQVISSISSPPRFRISLRIPSIPLAFPDFIAFTALRTSAFSIGL